MMRPLPVACPTEKGRAHERSSEWLVHAEIHDFDATARDVGRDSTGSLGEPIEAGDAQSVPMAIGVPEHCLLFGVEGPLDACNDEALGLVKVREVDLPYFNGEPKSLICTLPRS
jgi:hypothetical protein